MIFGSVQLPFVADFYVPKAVVRKNEDQSFIVHVEKLEAVIEFP